MQRRRKSSTSIVKQQGFTLIELVLVIVIVAMLAAIVLPIFDSSVPRVVLESEARKLASELSDMQQEAIFSNTTYGTRIYAGESSLVVYSMSSSDEISEEYTYHIGEPVVISGTSFPAGILYYTPVGSPGEGGSITLSYGSSRTANIQVAPLTGKISISGI